MPGLKSIDESYPYALIDPRGEVIEQRYGKARVSRLDLGLGTELALVYLPGGLFSMGSADSLFPEETPRHIVSVSPFWLARDLITQAQWRSVAGKLPACRFHGDDLPLENASFSESQEFCRRLVKICGLPFRLPSEAEWEYACRAGTTTPFSTGETITTALANYCGEHTYRDEPKGIYRHAPTPAGTFPKNPFGLNDLHANLWEWCLDSWHPDYIGAPFDGQPWMRGGETDRRVARGGSWHEPPINCRSAVRLRLAENDRDDFYGFRVALPGGSEL